MLDIIPTSIAPLGAIEETESVRVFPGVRTIGPRFLGGLLALTSLASLTYGDEPKASTVAPGSFREQVAPILEKYCNKCHGGARPKADLNLTAFTDEASVAKDLKVWEQVLEFVRSGEMPPEGKPKPSEEESARLVHWIEAQLSTASCSGLDDPGRVTLRRLNRSEYNNTIRDLVGVDFRPADDFPSDDVGYGFDNIGDVLSLPPILMEKYLAAAEQVAEKAIVADPRPTGPTKHWEGKRLKGGSSHGDACRILASTGEIYADHDFPKDGDYLLRARAYAQQAGPEPAKMAFRLGDKDLHAVDVTAEEAEPAVYEFAVQVPAGKQKVAVAFLNDYFKADDPNPDRRDRNLLIERLEVVGPLELPTLPETHKRIVSETPRDGNDREVARKILEPLATRAYRRPLRPGEVDRLAQFVELAKKSGDSFEKGIQLALEAMLVSPHFLFRVEVDRVRRPQGQQQPPPGSVRPLNDYELASRLSYFLWSSLPDEELFRLAGEGKLHEDATLEAQALRMMKDPKAKALTEDFADQWLQVRNLKTVTPDPKLFPAFDDALRAAMLRETELFFEAIMAEDRSVLDFLDADFTFVNEKLARHYGLSDVKGDEFRRVTVPGDRRGGVLTLASVLTITSNPTRTSPVKRGKWILEQILGTPPPPPPPDVPELKEDVVLTGTLRQRMEQHRSNPSCASCHSRMDALGFGFENYDAVGAWREKDGSFAIDPAGTLPSGETFAGPAELKKVLKKRQAEFARCLTGKMMTYALGRGLDYPDRCAVDRVVDGLAQDQYRFSRLVLGIVKSDPFRKRKGEGATP
jgi:hypothetical protein